MNQLLRSFEERVSPQRCAILLVDFQNDFCHPAGYIGNKIGIDLASSNAFAQRNQMLADAGRAAGAWIVWVRAVYNPEYLPASMLVKGGFGEEQRCIEGSWGANFFGVNPSDDDLHIVKNRYSAFSGTVLDEKLKKRSVETTIITGVTTNICVESTLRDAFNLGYHVVIPEDCVGANDEDLHDATLKNVSKMLGDVTKAEVLLNFWHQKN